MGVANDYPKPRAIRVDEEQTRPCHQCPIKAQAAASVGLTVALDSGLSILIHSHHISCLSLFSPLIFPGGEVPPSGFWGVSFWQ